MGQVANQMALELFFKLKERIKEKKEKRVGYELNLDDFRGDSETKKKR